jgi:hypothetical protein
MRQAWERENKCNFLVRNPEANRPLGEPCLKLEDNIKIHSK